MYTDDDLQKLTPEEKRRESHSIQMQMVILESDLKRNNSKQTNYDSEIRKLKTEGERIRVQLDEKHKEQEKVKWEITQQEAEIKKLRKKLNLLR
jgi:predicted  nucleic acid-binding Zn-ribbon protein